MKLIETTANTVYNLHKAKYVPRYCRWNEYDSETAPINGDVCLWFTNPFSAGLTSAVYTKYDGEWYYVMDMRLYTKLRFNSLSFTFDKDQLKKGQHKTKKVKKPIAFINSYEMIGREARRTPSGVRENNDCTVIAYATAMNADYAYAHDILTSYGRQPRRGVNMSSVVNRMITDKKPLISVKKLTDKLISIKKFAELHPKGRYILIVSHHALAVIDGVIHDHSCKPMRRVLWAYKYTGGK